MANENFNPSVPSQVVAEVKFPKFINNLGIIPTSYKDSMSYYECLAWLCKFLEEQVIPTVNENGEAVEELQGLYVELKNYLLEAQEALSDKVDNLEEYMTNYFNNLDVQEEINNKLNEMLEHGDLASIIESFLGAQKIYNTFQNVIEDSSNLVTNQKIKTFGYNTINDGGAGEYIITDTKNETDFYADITESLFAKLILPNNEVNINSLGADNTGETDSSVLLNSTISKINSRWLSNKFNVNTILLNGTYLINNQIKLSPFVKLRGTGYVTILTNVSNDSAIHIAYLSNVDNPSEFPGNKLDWQHEELINFEKGGIIKNIDGEFQNTCIEIGTRADWGVYKAVSRYVLKNFRIYNYNIGILHNRYHVYLGKYENLSFENVTIGIQYGTTANTAVVDSGENMSYLNCLFANRENAVKWFTDGFDSSFELCSFDFLNDVFLDASTKGYKKISCNQCHFEGFRSSIMNTIEKYAMFIMTSCTILDSDSTTERKKIFKNVNNAPIVFDNNKYYSVLMTSYDPSKMYFDIGCRIKGSNYIGVGNTWVGFLKDNNLLGNVFDNITDGVYTNDTGHDDSQFNNWKFEYDPTLISNQFEIDTDDYIYTGHKSLIVKSNSEATTGKNIIVTTDYIDVKNYSWLIFNDFTYNMRINSSPFVINFYDVNKTLIKTSNLTHTSTPANPKTSNTWYSSSIGVSTFVPENCCYIKVTVQYGNINNSSADPVGTEYKIGGICINAL